MNIADCPKDGTLNPKMKAQIQKGWQDYKLGLESQEEMNRLLNVLEAHGETLDGLHDVCANHGGKSFFCGIYMTCRSDAEVARVLLDYNLFFESEDAMMDWITGWADDCGESFEETLNGFEDAIRTSDGFVVPIYCQATIHNPQEGALNRTLYGCVKGKVNEKSYLKYRLVWRGC